MGKHGDGGTPLDMTCRVNKKKAWAGQANGTLGRTLGCSA